MQAIRAHDYGGPDVLVLEQAPRPEPKANEVLIRVKAAGINPADWKMRAGLFKGFSQLPFPWTPGFEAAGTVEAVGADVTAFHRGQDVYGIVTGGYAELALANAKDVSLKPKSLTFDEAAAVPVGALVAWQAVIEKTDVEIAAAGGVGHALQRVLVQGAAGGVGSYVVQLAHWRGANVIGTASANNVDFVRSLGAETVIDYNATTFETIARDVDVVIDTVGGDIPDRSWQVLGQDGVFVTIAARLADDAGAKHGVRAMGSGRASADKLQVISELLESKEITPIVGAVFPLADAQKAQELSQTGHGRGRIILHIAD